MSKLRERRIVLLAAGLALAGLLGCRTHMPHAFTWPAGGNIQQTHAKPPEGGYYANWDPFAVALEVTPVEDVNPVRTQHVLVATVLDKKGKGLPNRRVEWMLAEGSVGDIVEVDESGWRASRGYKVDNRYAISHTNNFDHVLDMGTDDPSDDIHLKKGQTWCVITSPIEGDSHVVVYAPGIYDWNKHKVFVTKHWYDIRWEFPPPATNPIGTTHEFSTAVRRYSDGAPLAGYSVTYRILDGPPAAFEPGGGQTATVKTDGGGMGTVMLRQARPAEGTNNIQIEIVRPEDIQCCKPAVHIATGQTSKTWIGPKIACNKTAPAQVLAGEQFEYTISVSNPSRVDATNVMVTDTLPEGIAFVAASPPAEPRGQVLSWALGTVPAGGQKTVGIQVKATRTGRFENCAEVRAEPDLATRCCATTAVSAPKLVLEKQCPKEVMICEPLEFVIVVRNAGDGPATRVVVTDELPEGLRTEDGQGTVTANVGDLAAGQAREIRFRAKAARTGQFSNRALARADGGLTAEASCMTVVRQPVLQVTKTGPEMRFVGRNAEYELTVTNTGDAPARDTVLVDTLPTGTTFVSASEGGQMAEGRVTWRLGTLEPGASRRVMLTVRAVQMGAARNTAVATAFCAEASAAMSTEIRGMAAILLEVEDIEDPIEVGGNDTYVIVVTNQGSAIGTNIVIECTLPPEQQYVSSDGPVRATAQGQTVRFAPLPSLDPKAKATYRVTVKGLRPGDVRFGVSLKSDQLDSPVQETESTHIYE